MQAEVAPLLTPGAAAPDTTGATVTVSGVGLVMLGPFHHVLDNVILSPLTLRAYTPLFIYHLKFSIYFMYSSSIYYAFIDS
jgi:hypothetical protein